MRPASPGTTTVDAAPERIATRLREVLADVDVEASPAATLSALVGQGLDRLPRPGAGHTLDRWRALAAVAEHDLALAKLYEGHTDALAILEDLGESGSVEPGSIWGVWAAEAPAGRAVIERHADDGEVVLGGGKSWCSGAVGASHALLTAWHADGRGPQLVRIELHQPGVRVEAGGWHAVGMSRSASIDVRFEGARARLVGGVGDYLARPGFWQGGAGIAACWLGGTLAVAAPLVRAVADASTRTALRMTALGKVDLAIGSTTALLRDAAAWIDAHPGSDAAALALRVRLSAEDSAGRVLDEVGRALGAAPFCRDARFARAAADLPVFARQSHAERDFAALGERVLAEPPGGQAPTGGRPWAL